MNKIKMFIVIMMLTCVSSFPEVGILIGGGMNFSNLSRGGDYQNTIQDNRTLAGFNLNWMYWLTFKEKMGVLAGVSYETRGTENHDYTQKSITLNYVQVPLLFSYKIKPINLEARVGPELGILVNATGNTNNRGADISSYFQKTDLAISLNICYTLMNMFVVGAGYDLGLMNAMDNAKTGMNGSMNNQCLKISIAYKWTARPGK